MIALWSGVQPAFLR